MTDPNDLVRQVARLRVDPQDEDKKLRIAIELCKTLGLSNCEVGDVVMDSYPDYDQLEEEE